MEDESPVTLSSFDELHYWDIQGDHIKFESDVTRNIID